MYSYLLPNWSQSWLCTSCLPKIRPGLLRCGRGGACERPNQVLARSLANQLQPPTEAYSALAHSDNRDSRLVCICASGGDRSAPEWSIGGRSEVLRGLEHGTG
jgi:hypothetical protein